MTRMKTVGTLLLAAAAFVSADQAFLWLAQHSICALDACKPMTFADSWWIPVLQTLVLLLSGLSVFRKVTPDRLQHSKATFTKEDA